MFEPKVVYEDQDLVAIVKPAGLLVHPVKALGRIEETLVDWLIDKYPEIKEVGDDPQIRPGIVHRLDKDTSGIMVVAKNQKTFGYLKSLFKDHKIIKKYTTIVYGLMKLGGGVVDRPIGIKTGSIKRTVFSTKMAKEAITKYEVLKNLKAYGNDFSFLEVWPLTGRTHQIRVHLALIGHPVAGDKIYGLAKLKIFNPGRLMLHASSLEFIKSDGYKLKLEVDLPEDFKKLINQEEGGG